MLPVSRCYNGYSTLRHGKSADDASADFPGVTWFRRGYRSSTGHAEAFVLVKNGQSQI